MNIQQSGSTLKVTPRVAGAATYNGTYCHPTVTAGVPFTYAEEGGFTTVTELKINVESANRFTFTTVWSWTGPDGPCTGTSSGVGTR